MSGSSRGHLLQALIWSLGLHAALLLNVFGVVPARLGLPPGRIDVVLGANRASPPSATSVSKPSATRVKRRPVAIARATSRRFAVAAAAPAVAALPEAVPDFPSSSALIAPAALPERVNADDLRQYRLSLAVAARRFRRYPPLAREHGWEGTAEVAVSVGALLPVPEVELVRSSGQAVLDEQALSMIGQAARSIALPGSLKGRELRVVLPVRFGLEGD